DDREDAKMTDPQDEFSPFWPLTVVPFGTMPQPPGSPPGPPSEFPRINPALLALWDWSKVPIPPAQAPWLPPAMAPATPPLPSKAHLASADDQGAMPESPETHRRRQGEPRGLLYSFSQPHQLPPAIWDSSPWGGGMDAPRGSRGILGTLSPPNNTWLGQSPYV